MIGGRGRLTRSENVCLSVCTIERGFGSVFTWFYWFRDIPRWFCLGSGFGHMMIEMQILYQ
jgi:hypothetical protein